jgi:single-stranded-DNA-specific exonuclease
VLDPTLLANIRDGATMLIQNISANNKAFIVVDADCDGYTSSAILLNYLNRLFPGWV